MDFVVEETSPTEASEEGGVERVGPGGRFCVEEVPDCAAAEFLLHLPEELSVQLLQ